MTSHAGALVFVIAFCHLQRVLRILVKSSGKSHSNNYCASKLPGRQYLSCQERLGEMSGKRWTIQTFIMAIVATSKLKIGGNASFIFSKSE